MKLNHFSFIPSTTINEFQTTNLFLVHIGHTITARSMLKLIPIIQEKEHTAIPAQRYF